MVHENSQSPSTGAGLGTDSVRQAARDHDSPARTDARTATTAV